MRTYSPQSTISLDWVHVKRKCELGTIDQSRVRRPIESAATGCRVRWNGFSLWRVTRDSWKKWRELPCRGRERRLVDQSKVRFAWMAEVGETGSRIHRPIKRMAPGTMWSDIPVRERSLARRMQITEKSQARVGCLGVARDRAVRRRLLRAVIGELWRGDRRTTGWK